MGNGFYIGGFLNQEPSCYVELKQSGEIIINAPAGLTVNGNISVSGSINASSDIVGGGISLDNHTHTCPDGETSPPH
jgi:phage baseplate assembly protein gpV